MESIVVSAEYSDTVSIKTMHYHDCHQIIFVLSGSAQVCINNITNRIKCGDIVIISRFDHHSVVDQTQDYCRFILEISPDLPNSIDDNAKIFSVLFNRPEGFRNFLHVGEKFHLYTYIFREIVSEYAQEKLMHRSMLNLLVQQLLIQIYRISPETRSAVSNHCFETVYQIQLFIQRNYASHITLDEISRDFNFSISYLAHQFKKITGKSVMGYLLSCRLAAAKKHLAQSDMPINEIVSSCGFSDSSNFSRVFRKNIGISPSAFRASFRMDELTEDTTPPEPNQIHSSYLKC